MDLCVCSSTTEAQSCYCGGRVLFPDGSPLQSYYGKHMLLWRQGTVSSWITTTKIAWLLWQTAGQIVM